MTSANCLVVLALLVAGCGSSGDGGGSTSQAREAPPAGGTTAETPAPPAETAQARRGVRLAKVGDFESPLFVTARPGDNSRIYVVEQAGGSSSWPAGGGGRCSTSAIR